MYLVTIDPQHGVVVAPRSREDRTACTEAALAAHDFHWNVEIEAYTHSTATDRETAAHAAVLLASMRHAVISV